jgi:RNA polymerase sigma factor (sigma-70 family)
MTLGPIFRASKRLPAEEQRELAARAKAGDQKAFERLLSSYQPMIFSVAQKHLWSGVEIEELIAEGSLGLKMAVDKYDPDHSSGAGFSTHANWWLFSRIRLASHRLNDNRVDNKTGRVQVNVPAFSLDANAARGDGEGSPIGQFFASDVDVEAEAIANEEAAQAKAIIERFAASLTTDLQRDVLRDRLASEDPCKLHVIGARHGLSRERVRQVETELVVRLRRFANFVREIEMPRPPIERSPDVPMKKGVVSTLDAIGDAEIRALWLEHRTLHALRRKYGCGTGAARRRVEKLGLFDEAPPIWAPIKPSGLTPESARAAVAEHGGFNAAARALGLSPVTVKRWSQLEPPKQEGQAVATTEPKEPQAEGEKLEGSDPWARWVAKGLPRGDELPIGYVSEIIAWVAEQDLQRKKAA